MTFVWLFLYVLAFEISALVNYEYLVLPFACDPFSSFTFVCVTDEYA